jgi:hypothetical protein
VMAYCTSMGASDLDGDGDGDGFPASGEDK